MTATAIALCVACQVLIIAGQLHLKQAMGGEPGSKHAVRKFVIGVGCLAVWFFLWLGLMGRWDLSKLYPFEGLNPAMMAIGAWLFLKEKLPVSAWFGLALVCAGIAAVSTS